MALTLYNTLTRRQEPFQPLEAGKVRMYCCGVTVYDYCHLGHARSYIVWDVIRRYLQWRGYEVRYVQNFTDIDDKILNRAQRDGSTMQAVAERFIQAYFEDMKRLNILEADEYPRATYSLNGIKRLIHELERKGYAYAAGGDVYYSVRHFSQYGKLSGRKLEELQAGASGRVEAGDYTATMSESSSLKKKDPFDFALWKSAKSGDPGGAPAWESPWGPGRPGWHIECSAMVRDSLGETIDIHVGGSDLIFPHHDNEIAQSEVVTGQPLSRYWLHNGMVNVGGEKMSKSLGNFTTIRQLLDNQLPALDGSQLNPMALRLFVLQAHYRKPIDFTAVAIAAAQNSWLTLKEGLLFGYQYGEQLGWRDRHDPSFGNPASMRISASDAVERFQTAMEDDFNTPGGISVLFELAKNLRREGNLLTHQGKADSAPPALRQQWQTLVCLAQVLGLEVYPEPVVSVDVEPLGLPSEVSTVTGITSKGLSDEEIESLVQQRQVARQAKNFAEGDRIRNELQAQGVILIDQPGGETRWHRR